MTQWGIGLLLGLAVSQGLVAGQWSTGAPMPTTRSELAAVALNKRIYVAGGLETFGTTTVFEAYDPAADTWETHTPLPVGLHHLGMAVAGGKIYVTGGYDSLMFNADRRSGWVYDPKTGEWNRIADMPGPRAAHAMVAIDGKLYVVGGVGLDPQDLWVYNPSADRWDSSHAAMPTAREHLAAVVFQGKLYAIGGRWGDRGNLSTVEVYDPATDQWQSRHAMPSPRSGFTAAVIRNQIHVVGGEELGLVGETFTAHEVYDPASDSWSHAPGPPTARHGLASATVGGRWCLIGGATKAGKLTLVTLSERVELFTPEGLEMQANRPQRRQLTLSRLLVPDNGP